MNSNKVTLSPPFKGLNSKNGVTAGSNYASILDNFVVKDGALETRKGHTLKSTIAGIPYSFHNYKYRGFDDLLIATESGIYNALTAQDLQAGMSGHPVDAAQFNGQLHFVNGHDQPIRWGGAAFTTTAWNLINPDTEKVEDITNIFAFNHRLYLWDNRTQDFWYSDPDAIQGDLHLFRLSLVGGFGGNLIAINSLSFDSGQGLDDYILFFMESGEVIAYLGSNPSLASGFSIQGIFNVHAPLSVSSIARVAGDLLVLASNDLISMRTIIGNGITSTGSKISNIIRDTLNSSAYVDSRLNVFFSKRYGWIIVNLPISTETSSQLIISNLDDTVSRFTNFNASCWGEVREELYFCKVKNGFPEVHHYNGRTDELAKIISIAVQGFTSFQSAQLKRISAIKYIMRHERTLEYEIGIGVDYQAHTDYFPSSTGTESVDSSWDSSVWDVDYWYRETAQDAAEWEVIGQIGQDFAISLILHTNGKATWSRTDLLIERGMGL